MTRWKLFKRSDSKNELSKQDVDQTHQDTTEPTDVKHEMIDKNENSSDIVSQTEYNETLYSNGTEPEDAVKDHKKSWKRQNWDDMETIEGNVDTIDDNNVKTTNQIHSSEIDKKVDKLLSKHKKK